jgi:hypothetical protein
MRIDRKAIIGLGALAVAICSAAGVDASRPVEALIGLALIVLPVVVYFKRNHGISYAVASKAIAALPAALAGVFLLLGIDVGSQLDAIGRQLLAVLPFLIAAVGNGAAKPVADPVDPSETVIDGVGRPRLPLVVPANAA